MLSDILLSGYWPKDLSVLRAEIRGDHRVRSRLFMLRYIPPNSIGAELGVFTGLLSSHLAKHHNAARVTFVDPWWLEFGDYYPDWGAYTNFGRVRTRAAHAASERRVLRHRMPNRFIEVASSCDWLAAQVDESLDWVYLDTTHSYEGTKQELALLERKLRHGGLILGDDWYEEGHQHYGVCLAVNEFVKNSNFATVFCGVRAQWLLRKSRN